MTRASRDPPTGQNDDDSSQSSKSLASVGYQDLVSVGYQDFSKVQPEPTLDPNNRKRESAMVKEPTFPAKLHMILSNPEYQEIIAWLPHGRSWRILQQRAFEEHVIPLYFRHGRYSSFARQVNGWGFRRVTHGSDYNSYYHEKFLRGMPHLCDKMRRLTAKDLSQKKKMAEYPTPDFYRISRQHPVPESPNVRQANKALNSTAQTTTVQNPRIALNAAVASALQSPSAAMHAAFPVSELPKVDIEASVLSRLGGNDKLNNLLSATGFQAANDLQDMTAAAALRLAAPTNIASQISLQHSLQQLKAASAAENLLYGPLAAQSIQRQLTEALAAKADMDALVGMVSRNNTNPLASLGYPWIP